jgi:NADH dehydrogenase/NADH:ubiquinone oxidoreductase subunit G
MGGVNRDGGCWGGEQAADQSGSWSVERDALWTWLAEALDRLAGTKIEATDLEALCGHVLDTHAPAALVHAQAAGIALERLVAARLAVTYVERYGRTTGPYDVARMRAVVRQLQGAGRGSAA